MPTLPEQMPAALLVCTEAAPKRRISGNIEANLPVVPLSDR